jgi:exonuclease SbcC
MRLHALTVTAFGPFAGRSSVDFDRLGDGGLFLLHGPTGAGKTSVLDAVCYALYGEVPGARGRSRLRSDHAADHTPTEVVLELTVGGRRLEITRRPEQPRPKKRGNGTTLDKPVTLLRERLPGAAEWKALSRSHQEIGEEIRQLLGMSREQFCQVVLLPQGDFARFLRSDATERGELLGRLFDTGRFEAVERWLAEARRAAEAQLRAQDETLIALAHRAAQAAGPAARDEPLPQLTAGDPGLAPGILRWAAIARSTAREDRDAAALAAAAAQSAHREAQASHDAARDAAALRQRYDDARRRAAELDRAAEEFERIRRRLERSLAAERVAPALDALARAESERATADGRHRSAAAQLPPELARADADTLAAHERENRQALGRLDAALRAEQRIGEISRERARLERETAADDDAERECARWLAHWERAAAECRRRLDAAQEAATTAEHLAGRLDPLRRRAAAARRRDALADDERRAADRLTELSAAAAAAREHWLALKEARLDGMAAELADALRAGDPCPVCGSADHPDPARRRPEHVDRAAEDAAHTAYRDAEAERARAETETHTLRDRLTAARADAADLTADRLDADIAALEAQEAAARRTAADAHPAREGARRAEEEHARHLDIQRETQKRQAARVSQREALEAELAARRTEVDAVGDGGGTVAEQAARLQRRVRLLADAADAARAAADAERRRHEAQQRAAQAAHDAGFTTPAEATSALLGPDETATLRRRVESYTAQRAAVQAELTDPRLAAAAKTPHADPHAGRAPLDAAAERLRVASAAESAALARCAELDRLCAQATRQARTLAPRREQHARLRALAQLTAGTCADNELRMRLESYVLAARLEQVAAAASVRLRRMSAGRYTLTHTDAKTAGRARSGLGLRVVDAWTGTERDTATLSGGETFFASLALALGLADVVTDEAGAVRLDTLFIDEGFGSLDDQTLDEVLDVLDSLRERDRAVGIVSHVADLRHRIPAQLEVVKGRHGSTLRHRTAGGSGHPTGAR